MKRSVDERYRPPRILRPQVYRRPHESARRFARVGIRGRKWARLLERLRVVARRKDGRVVELWKVRYADGETGAVELTFWRKL